MSGWLRQVDRCFSRLFRTSKHASLQGLGLQQEAYVLAIVSSQFLVAKARAGSIRQQDCRLVAALGSYPVCDF